MGSSQADPSPVLPLTLSSCVTDKGLSAITSVNQGLQSLVPTGARWKI